MNKAAQAIQSVEDRAFAARLTITQLCERAQVRHDVLSRAKQRAAISISTLVKLEKALDEIERGRG